MRADQARATCLETWRLMVQCAAEGERAKAQEEALKAEEERERAAKTMEELGVQTKEELEGLLLEESEAKKLARIQQIKYVLTERKASLEDRQGNTCSNNPSDIRMLACSLDSEKYRCPPRFPPRVTTHSYSAPEEHVSPCIGHRQLHVVRADMALLASLSYARLSSLPQHPRSRVVLEVPLLPGVSLEPSVLALSGKMR